MTAPDQSEEETRRMTDDRAEKALREAERRLRESEARFKRFAESLPQFIWESDADGAPVYVNQRWTDYSGLTLEQTGDAAQLTAAFHPEDEPAVAREWRHARATATAMNVEGRIRRRDGVYRSFLVRAEPVLENGVPVRWFGSCTDITDLKGAEERIRSLADDVRIRLEEHETLLRCAARRRVHRTRRRMHEHHDEPGRRGHAAHVHRPQRVQDRTGERATAFSHLQERD